MGQAQLSRCVLCRHTADNVADGSGRLPSEGGWGIAAAEGEVVGQQGSRAKGRAGKKRVEELVVERLKDDARVDWRQNGLSISQRALSWPCLC